MVQFLTIISLAGVALAQTGVPNDSFNSTVISGIASSLDANTAAAWCSAQFRACNVLCGSAGVTNNNCTTSDLSYSCVCTSNSSSPAFQYYNPDMITNICNKYLGNCLAENAGRADLQNNCKTSIICGNSSVDAYANSSAGSTSGSSTTSSSASQSATGSSTSATASATKAASAAVKVAQGYATPIFGAILLGVFGLAL